MTLRTQVPSSARDPHTPRGNESSCARMERVRVRDLRESDTRTRWALPGMPRFGYHSGVARVQARERESADMSAERDEKQRDDREV